MTIKEGWVTTAEAAELLNLSPATVREAVTRGKLQAERVGSFHLVARTEIERYRREHLGRQGWNKRRAPDYTPSPMAKWARDYRARKKAQQPSAAPEQGE